mmetsp:Transcript_41853/g.95102  ORF Transcript_41853/g.95102 Transcript_41853/m.95102 type:complete len:260 (-) Transcript_41853:59-838(-)
MGGGMSTLAHAAALVDNNKALAAQAESMCREAFRYTACYCEENVWRLCEDLLGHRQRAGLCPSVAPSGLVRGSLKAVFISNAQQRVPLWHQRAGGEREVLGAPGFVLWDYHVVALLQAAGGGCHILDLDTTLGPFPLPFADYVRQALRPDIIASFEAEGRCRELPERCFRVVDAEDYLQSLFSDRSHMRRPDGSWAAPPPTEPPILQRREGCEDGAGSNLFSQFVAMEPGSGMGEVLTEAAFLRRFSGLSEEVWRRIAA